MKTIYLAGGCFWGTEHYIRQFEGVIETVTGYANGNIPSPSYEEVYTDKTGYAECVKVTFDEEVLPLKVLCRLFFRSIDPLLENRQGNDIGTRYRTGIYWTEEADRKVVEDTFGEILSTYEADGSWSGPLAVEKGPLECFWPAEEYHQDYLIRNPQGYCHISPQTQHFARTYASLTRELAARSSHSEEGALPKEERYVILLEHIDRLDRFNASLADRMTDISLMISQTFGFWWTGFYMVKDDELVLGPYQGPLACMRIAYGRGVCGTAWKENRTIIVPDVEEFPGHIACSSESRSEIVVPIRHDGAVTGVLDIDSEKLGTFDETDALWLEKVVKLISPDS